MASPNQKTARSPALDEYWDALEPHLPPFAPDEQRTAIALYRELAKARSVDDARLAAALNASHTAVRALLEQDSFKAFVYRDTEGRVVGFGGLATTPMHHRFEVDGRILSTWCAWHSLFVPQILQRPARVESADPENGVLVRLVVTSDGIATADPADAVVSFIRPEAGAFQSSADNLLAKFCHFVFFFESARSHGLWARKHPGTFPLSLDEAFALGRRLNARKFGLGLAPAPEDECICSPQGSL